MKRSTFYALSFTWGLPLTLCGFFVALFLIVAGRRPKRFGWVWCFEIGKGWGGLNLGVVFLCQEGAPDNLKCHEFGHALQNCMWGALMPFVVHLPSIVRYWSREWKAAHGANLPPYDAIWFEGQATRWGIKYYNRTKEEDAS